MRSLASRILFILLSALPLSSVAMTTLQSPARGSGQAPSSGHSMPVAGALTPGFYFEPNQGQFAAGGDYLLRGRGYSVSLQAMGATMVLGGTSHGRTPNNAVDGSGNVVRVRLVDANNAARPGGEARLQGHSGYYRGSDPKDWLASVPHVARVRYAAVYPGIDVVYYGRDGQLEYDFVLAPHADSGRIRLRIDGAERVGLNARGDMVLDTAAGTVTMHAPVAYQERNGVREEVASRYHLEGNKARIVLADYDRSRPLIIDPALTFAGYLGGTGDDEIRAVAVDGAGNIYVTGTTASNDLAKTWGSYQGYSDIFVAKYDASGALKFLTYLGSDNDFEEGRGIAIGPGGKVYVTGAASKGSTGFPATTNSYSSCNYQTLDAFIAVLDGSNGVPTYVACVGGGLGEVGEAIAVDVAGNAYITGRTYSGASVTPSFPATGGVFQTQSTANASAPDAFFMKLNPAGQGSTDLVYASYLGGDLWDEGRGIALDGSGNLYITGFTLSNDFPTTAQAIQSSLSGGQDAFVAKVSADGSGLLYSSLLGGSSVEEGNAIAVDGAGNAFVTGWTASSDFPATAQDTTLGGGRDAFVARFNTAGSGLGLGYTRYLGGNGIDEGWGIAHDGASGVYVTGSAASTDFAANASGAAGSDAFLSHLGSSGAAVYSIALAGSGADATGDDKGEAVAADSKGNVYVAGWTKSYDFPVFPSGSSAWNASGNADGFIARIGPFADLAIAGTRTYSQSIYTYTMTVTNNGPDLATGVTVTDILPFGTSVATRDPSCSGDLTIICNLGSITAGAHITLSFGIIADTGTIDSNVVTVSGNEADTILSNNTTAPSGGTDETPVITIKPPAPGGGSGGGGGGGGGVFGPLFAWLCVIGLWGVRRRERRLTASG